MDICSDEQIQLIELETRGQTTNSKWFEFRCGKVTASTFGEINNRKSSTPPDRLIREIFQNKQATTTPIYCVQGHHMEPVIKEKYIEKKVSSMGHCGLKVTEKGLMIDKTCPLIEQV